MQNEISYDVKVLAANDKRLGNFIIDLILIYIVNTAFIYGLFYLIGSLRYSASEGALNALTYLISYLNNFLYYFITESYLNGKSIAKYITKTTAVRTDYGRLSNKDAALRSLCRLIPFDAFSFLGVLGKGWHDKFSNTIVIDDKLYAQFGDQNTIDKIGQREEEPEMKF